MEDAETIINSLLGGTVEELDLPPRMQMQVYESYADVGTWMSNDQLLGEGDWTITGQGSSRLGTTVQPVGRDEYDVDSIARWSVAKTDISKADLKEDVGASLKRYVAAAESDVAPNGIEEGKRCWTLTFDQPFHMDVLPAISDVEEPPHGLLITDRELFHWQSSNPEGFADWFFERAGQPFRDARTVLAKRAEVEIDDLPRWQVRSPLQRTVQVIKAHRNVYFADDLHARPPSIMITALAAHAYEGQTSLVDAVLSSVQRMPSLLEVDASGYIVQNPGNRKAENYAERFSKNEAARRAFPHWLDDLERTIDEVLGVRGGLQEATGRLGRAFGDQPVQKAAQRWGESLRQTPGTGQPLTVNRAGTLASAGAAGVVVKKHTFHGR